MKIRLSEAEKAQCIAAIEGLLNRRPAFPLLPILQPSPQPKPEQRKRKKAR